MRSVFRSCLSAVGLALVFGCAFGAPEPPAPNRSVVWGYVKLVPHPGVELPTGDGSAYSSRRFRDARPVDYSQPGFAAVYVETAEPGPADAPAAEHIEIRDGSIGLRLTPDRAVRRMGSTIRIENTTADPMVVSCPRAHLIQALAPGAKAAVALTDPGEYEIFLLDRPGIRSLVFSAPGPYSVLSDSGRYTIRDLAPGETELKSWHPRFPPTRSRVHLLPGRVLRQDFEVGVGRGDD